MKKLFLTSVAFVATVGIGIADELPSIKSASAATPVPIWTGFYAGLNAGYGFGTNGSITSYSYSQTANINVSPDPSRVEYTPQVTGVGQAQSGLFGNMQSGFIGGAQVGYNYQFASRYMLGFETDIQTSGLRGSSQGMGAGYNGYPWKFAFTHPALTVFNPIGNTTINSGVDWFGTARARLGFLYKPTLLIYGTGGLTYGAAYGDYYNSVIANHFGFGTPDANDPYNHVWVGNGHSKEFLVGWNAGAGLEWMFISNWSVKAEALYWNLGSFNIPTNTVNPPPIPIPGANSSGWVLPMATVGRAQINYQGVITRLGINYHFNFKMIENPDFISKKNTSYTLTSDKWNGFYAGLNIGYSLGPSSSVSSQNWNFTPWQTTSGPILAVAPYSMTGFTTVSISGGLGGAQIGYNYAATNKIIAGLIADIQGGNLRDAALVGSTGPSSYSAVNSGLGNTSIYSGVDYLGTARGRLGYLLSPDFLLYATAGLSYGGVYSHINQASVEAFSLSGTAWTETWTGSGSSNKLLVGWNGGGGVEWLITPNWSINAETIYWNLGNANISTCAFSPTSHSSSIFNNNMAWGNTSINFQGILARTGVNYHFNLANVLPVVAKF